MVFMLDFGCLLSRLYLGLTMIFAHGYPKYLNYAQSSVKFPDPLGIGSPLSLSLVIFAECVCAVLVSLGLFTRLALIPLIITMGIAFFIIHCDDPFTRKELSFMFLCGYGTLFFLGSGNYNLQRFVPISVKHPVLKFLFERS
ncbi:DoxX family protein [Candidatus Marinamargulisbacteria bacterium SCGC AG-410-N11]|nr:DoxX family protein [Candidatus Marinamargulisbacteria bacterium SCGC AG-410-N11]